MWVSNGLMVWSILTMVMVVCRLTILFFRPQGTYVPCIYVVHLRDRLLSCQLQRAYALTFSPGVEGMWLKEL